MAEVKFEDEDEYVELEGVLGYNFEPTTTIRLVGEHNNGLFSERASRLIINKQFHIEYTREKPNLWFRIWYFILLGWKWEDC